MTTRVGEGHNKCCDGYKGILRTTRDAVVAIGLAEHHTCDFLWKPG